MKLDTVSELELKGVFLGYLLPASGRYRLDSREYLLFATIVLTDDMPAQQL
jgi:hypothetical protein